MASPIRWEKEIVSSTILIYVGKGKVNLREYYTISGFQYCCCPSCPWHQAGKCSGVYLARRTLRWGECSIHRAAIKHSLHWCSLSLHSSVLYCVAGPVARQRWAVCAQSRSQSCQHTRAVLLWLFFSGARTQDGKQLSREAVIPKVSWSVSRTQTSQHVKAWALRNQRGWFACCR